MVSLRQALTLLGPKRTRSLLLGRYLVDSLSDKSISGLDMSYFWRRSLASSVVASRFADAILPRHRDEAFIAALLADIGVPILAEAMPQDYAPIVARFAPMQTPATPDEELEAVDATHSDVSAMVLTHWSLPETVCKAVNLQHSDNPGDGPEATVARILNAADRIGRLLCEIPSEEETLQTCTDAMAFVGIEPSVLVKMLPTIESDLEELADVLRIDVIPGNVYALIAKTIQDRLATPA